VHNLGSLLGGKEQVGRVERLTDFSLSTIPLNTSPSEGSQRFFRVETAAKWGLHIYVAKPRTSPFHLLLDSSNIKKGVGGHKSHQNYRDALG